MATLVTRYVNPDSSGGDGTTSALSGANAAYVSLAAWQTARVRDLVDADECEIVVCDSAGTADTTAFSTYNKAWTTDETHYFTITTAAASKAGTLWSDSKYRIKGTAPISMYGAGHHCIIDGLQVEYSGGAPTASGSAVWLGYVHNVIVQNCHARNSDNEAGQRVNGFHRYEQTTTCTVRNCIADNFIGSGADGYGFKSGAFAGTQVASVNFENCTAVNSHYGFYLGNLASGTLTNCGAAGCDNAWSAYTTVTCSSTTPSFAAADNYRLLSTDTTWKGQGTDLSAYFTTDINGNTRPSAWAIGASESGTPSTVTHYVNPDADASGDGTTSALSSVDNTHAYQSLSAWEAARARDLVAAHEIEEVICDSDGTADTTPCAVYQTWNTNVDCKIIIKTAAASKAGTQWSTSKYRLDIASGNYSLLIDGQAGSSNSLWVEVDGLQIAQNKTGAHGYYYPVWIKYVKHSETVTVKNCLIETSADTGTPLLYGIFLEATDGATINLQNNIIVNSYASGTQIGVNAGSNLTNSTVNLRNLTVVGYTTGVTRTSGTVNATNVGVSGATTGFSGTITQTTCSTTTPLFIDEAGGDYALTIDDRVWKKQGTNLSEYFTDDITGTARPSSWSIGAADRGSTQPPPESLPEDPGVGEVDPPPEPVVIPPLPGEVGVSLPSLPSESASVFGSAILNPMIPLLWLLELDIGGITYGFASCDISIPYDYTYTSSMSYHGAIAMRSAPRQDVDIYDGRASACRCSIELAPIKLGITSSAADVRPIDLADYHAEDLVGIPARVYRYAELTTMTDRDCVIRGNVTGASGSGESGTLTLDIEDFSTWYASTTLPPYLTNATLWPDADEDDHGQRLPMVYGTFANVRVPNIDTVDTSNGVHGIGHHLYDDPTGGRVGDTAHTPTLTNGTDSDGNPYAAIEYSIETLNKDTLVSGTGYADDSNGYFSGTASSLLVNISDQLHHLAVVGIACPQTGAAAMPKGFINHNAFVAFRNATTGHVNTIVISGDFETDYFSVAQEALRPYSGACFVERGLLTIKRINFDAPAVMAIKQDELLHNAREVRWSGYQPVPGSIEIKYAWGYHTAKKQWDFLARRLVTSSEAPAFGPALIAGAKPLKIEAPHIRDATTIEGIVTSLRTLYAKPRRTFTVTASRECSIVGMLDVVEITSTIFPSSTGLGMTDKRAVVIGIEYGLGTSTLTLLEA